MKLIHSSLTTIDAPASSTTGEAGDVFGAIPFEEDLDHGMVAHYRLTRDLDRIIDLPNRIMDIDEESVIEEIKKRHRHESGYSYVAESKVSVYTGSAKHTLRTGANGWTEEKAFLILPKPVVDSVTSFELLRDLTQKHGAVYILPEVAQRMATQAGDGHNVANKFNDENFTFVSLSFNCKSSGSTAHDLVVDQINWNPRAIDLRPYYAKRSEFYRRSRPDLNKDVRHSLLHAMNPRRWPDDYAYKGLIQGPEPYDRHGWGYKCKRDVTIEDVMTMIDFNRQAGPKTPWWREDMYRGYYGCTYTFRSAVIEALKNVHAIEEVYSDQIKCGEHDFKEAYRNYLTEINRPMSAKEYKETGWSKREHLKEAHDWMRLCRWLRKEAKSMGVEMPAKPVQPMTPVQIDRKRRAAVKKRKLAAKRRRKANKLKCKTKSSPVSPTTSKQRSHTSSRSSPKTKATATSTQPEPN